MGSAYQAVKVVVMWIVTYMKVDGLNPSTLPYFIFPGKCKLLEWRIGTGYKTMGKVEGIRV